MSLILPTKRLSERRSLLGMGAIILEQLKSPREVSRLWEDVKRAYATDSAQRPGLLADDAVKNATRTPGPQSFTYEWFVLALDFLYIVGVVDIRDGRVSKGRVRDSRVAETSGTEPSTASREGGLGTP